MQDFSPTPQCPTCHVITANCRKMETALILFFSLFLGALGDSSTTTDLLWPLPRSVDFGTTVYSLDPQTFAFLGSGPGGASAILKVRSELGFH